IKRIDKEHIQVERNSGEIATEPNPDGIARQYSINLVERFQQVDELLEKHRGKRKLVFPWTHAVVLTHVEGRVLRDCEKMGIWEKGRVLGKQDLTSDCFENSLH